MKGCCPRLCWKDYLITAYVHFYLAKIWKSLNSKTHLAPRVLEKGLWACCAFNIYI